MLRVRRKGLVFGPSSSCGWACHTALQPTPWLRDDGIVRVFVGMRDGLGRSRVGFVDVDAADPSVVRRVSETPVLDLGDAGSFDENGVVPCAVTQHEGRLLLFYAGYQLGQSVRFTVFSGLAESIDGGESFRRVSSVPVTDRSDDGRLFRVIHTILYEEQRWRVWYGSGNTFDRGSSKTLPRYDVRYMESDTPFCFPKRGQIAVPAVGSEHRIGRPYVIKNGSGYLMLYGIGTEREPYRLGNARSSDGRFWVREDDIDMGVQSGVWDSEMIAYPAVVRTRDHNILFYNGNDYGRNGFGYGLIDGLQ